MAENKKKKRRKPKLNVDALRSRAVRSEHHGMLESLKHRTSDLFEELEAGRLPREAIALETILSALGASEDGLDHSAIKDVYPVQSWREETITLPKALIRVIVEAWMKYRTAPEGKTFGECMNLEGGGQGTSPAKRRILQLNEAARLSNAVVVEYYTPGCTSWEAAIGAVAAKEGKSESTVRRASEKMRDRTFDRMARHGWIDEPDA